MRITSSYAKQWTFILHGTHSQSGHCNHIASALGFPNLPKAALSRGCGVLKRYLAYRLV